MHNATQTAQLEVTQGGTMKGNIGIPAAIFPPTARYGVRIYIRATKTEKRERQIGLLYGYSTSEARLAAYFTAQKRLGRDIRLSALYGQHAC